MTNISGQNGKLTHLLETIVRFAAKDFDARIELAGDDSELDAICLGINMLGEELSIMNKDLESRTESAFSLALIGQITAGVGHEINTPLSIILIELEAIENSLSESGLEGFPKQRITKAIDRQRRSIESIRLISSSLRNLARKKVDSEFIQVNFIPLLKETLCLVESFANKAGVAVVFTSNIETEPVLNGDPALLQQIILNLTKNAVDAMESTRIKKLLVHLNSTAEEIRLSIRDSGSGIPDQVVSTIFQPFVTTKPFGQGTGLGLSLVKKFTEMHGGSIAFERHEVGTSFYLRLPHQASAHLDKTRKENTQPEIFNTPGQEENIAVQNATNTPQKNPILIVEDDDDLREILSDLIQCLGFMTEEAINGKDALEKITRDQSRYELVLSDVQMPEMDGIELAKEWLKLTGQRPNFAFLTGGSVIPDFLVRQIQVYHKPISQTLIKQIMAEQLSAETLNLSRSKKSA